MAKKQLSVSSFILMNVVGVIASFALAYYVRIHTDQGEKKDVPSFMDWFNQGKVTLKGVFISLLFGTVFGFMDNFFLWVGIDKMMPFIPGGTLTKGAWGNTYSDFIGATIGASVASIGKDLLNSDPSPPIWINAIAMPLGCVLGMYGGKAMVGGN